LKNPPIKKLEDSLRQKHHKMLIGKLWGVDVTHVTK